MLRGHKKRAAPKRCPLLVFLPSFYEGLERDRDAAALETVLGERAAVCRVAGHASVVAGVDWAGVRGAHVLTWVCGAHVACRRAHVTRRCTHIAWLLRVGVAALGQLVDGFTEAKLTLAAGVDALRVEDALGAGAGVVELL